jgi:putative heme-binding domain-containing protein
MATILIYGCSKPKIEDTRIKTLDPKTAAAAAKEIEAIVKPQLAEGLTLKLWAGDSLIADPVSIDIDDQGKLYFTRTNRQKGSEFDIRSHQDWEIPSIALQSIEEKRDFLHRVLAPENSDKNQWLHDINNDGSRDWRDMTIQKEHVYRVEDTSGDGVADMNQLVVEDFHEEVTDAAGGVLKHGDDLFVAIGPDLWKLNDKNGDGVIDEKKSLSRGYGVHVGFSGHGMSGVEVGPDGRIYWQIGDIGFSGTDLSGKKWDHANSGVVVRSNPDGSDFEVFAYGNRNTHEFVFDEYGNMISEDNDGDHPGESERIVYIVNGADIGWRINWQFGKYRDPDNNTYKVWMDEKLYQPRFEGQAAYITPAIINYVDGPTGMLYNPGTALGPKYNNTFFVAEFVGNPAQSGVHAFKLKPKGATFEFVQTEKILGGVLATGLDWGPDGAMYVADWIDGWSTKDHGRVWKLDVADADMKVRKEVQQLLADDLRKYEIEKVGQLLMNADMRVRQKAQFELVRRGEDGLEQLKKYIGQKEHQLARVNAIWGVSQFARIDMKHADLLKPLLKDTDPEIRAQAAKWLGDVRCKTAGDDLLPLLKDEYSRARFFAAEALGRIEYEKAVQPIIGLLESNNDEDAYIRHAASLALARIGKAEPLKALANHPSFAVRLGAVVALRRMQHASIAAFLRDTDERVVTEAARAINDDHSIKDALPALGDALQYTPYKNEALIRRAINANLRVGSDKALDNLLAYATKSTNPVAMRAEALAALSTWAKPSVVDRVDGRYRGEITRDPEPVRAKAGAVLLGLTNAKENSLRLASIKALGKLQVPNSSSKLMASLKTDSDATVREQALKSLSLIPVAPIGDAIKIALADKEKNVRATALDLLPKMNISQETMVSLLNDVINTKTVQEKQAALQTLGTLPYASTGKVFDNLLTKLERKEVPVEIQLELSDAIDATGSADLKKKFKDITFKLNPDTVYAPFQGALLGGDPQRGGRIFYSHQTAQCIRCHSYGDYGGNAGPRLNGVASRLTREQLLEAVVNPSARLAPGYGMVNLKLKNGKSIGGILKEDAKEKLTLKVGNRPDTVIMVNDIAQRTNAASSMPPMRLLLTKKEIRDVVSFLATLKDDE